VDNSEGKTRHLWTIVTAVSGWGMWGIIYSLADIGVSR